MDPALPYGLSRQELRCIQLAGEGMRTKVIAREVGLSERTVSNHLGRAYRKLGVSSRDAAAARIADYYSGQKLGMSGNDAGTADAGASEPSGGENDKGLAGVIGRWPAPPAGPVRLGISLMLALIAAMLFAGLVVVMGVISEHAAVFAPDTGL